MDLDLNQLAAAADAVLERQQLHAVTPAVPSSPTPSDRDKEIETLRATIAQLSMKERQSRQPITLDDLQRQMTELRDSHEGSQHDPVNFTRPKITVAQSHKQPRVRRGRHLLVPP
ncbi:unnamed protein product [Echinostoma caproni]|uniref:Type III effector HopAS1 n=1 Tax=Echinostoma caproni TaxID=27848 RepID=A0A183B5S7_9TREM|nr:unnamed protein product [Echinostoma caproni]